jgi:citrate lyase beta subunit
MITKAAASTADVVILDREDALSWRQAAAPQAACGLSSVPPEGYVHTVMPASLDF